jgi:hypothetical protein
MLEPIDPRPRNQCVDLDLDGTDELFLRTAELQAVVKLDGSAAILELDAYALSQNFGDTLRRHAEHYHRRVLAARAAAPHQGGGIASAHDRLDLKHDISAADLVADPAARTLFRDAWVDANGGSRRLADYALRQVNGASVAFGTARGGATLQKEIALSGHCVSIGYRFAGAIDAAGICGFETTVDLAMPSCDGPGAHYRYRGVVAGGLGRPIDLEDMSELVLVDNFMGGSLTLRSNLPVRLRGRPCHTVSQSEGGFEKIMQSLTLTLSWPRDAAHANIDLSLEIRKHAARGRGGDDAYSAIQACRHAPALTLEPARRQVAAGSVQFVLQQLARLLECESRTARHHFRRIAITEVAQEIRLDAGPGEKLGIHFGVVESGHRSAFKPDGSRRDDEVAALDRTVAERGRLGVRLLVFAGEYAARILIVRKKLWQQFVELGVVSDDSGHGRGHCLVHVARAERRLQPLLCFAAAQKQHARRAGVHRRGRPFHQLVELAQLFVADGLRLPAVLRPGGAENQIHAFGAELHHRRLMLNKKKIIGECGVGAGCTGRSAHSERLSALKAGGASA